MPQLDWYSTPKAAYGAFDKPAGFPCPAQRSSGCSCGDRARSQTVQDSKAELRRPRHSRLGESHFAGEMAPRKTDAMFMAHRQATRPNPVAGSPRSPISSAIALRSACRLFQHATRKYSRCKNLSSTTLIFRLADHRPLPPQPDSAPLPPTSNHMADARNARVPCVALRQLHLSRRLKHCTVGRKRETVKTFARRADISDTDHIGNDQCAASPGERLEVLTARLASLRQASGGAERRSRGAPDQERYRVHVDCRSC